MYDHNKYHNHNSKFHLQWSGLSQGLQIIDICQHCIGDRLEVVSHGKKIKMTVWRAELPLHWTYQADLARCQAEENCCNVKPHEDYCLWLVCHSHGNSILPPQSSESTESRKHGSSMCPLPAELAGGTSQLKTRFTPGPGSDKILLLY